MQIQHAGSLIHTAAAIMQMNPITTSDIFVCNSDHDSVLHNRLSAGDIGQSNLVPQSYRTGRSNHILG